MSKKAIVLLAEGFEEVEAITPIDYLRRVGIEVTIAAVGPEDIGACPCITGSHGITLCADASLLTLAGEGKLDPSLWDAVIIPGGLPGADNLSASKETGAFLKDMAGAGKWICAICAAPARVLSRLGLLKGRKFTCFPGEEARIKAEDSGAEFSQDRVVVDQNILTSRGAGTAGEFACAIISALLGAGEGKKLAEKVLLSGAV